MKLKLMMLFFLLAMPVTAQTRLVVGLTDAQLLARYGPPVAVDGVDGIRWTYHTATGAFLMYVYRLHGTVVDVWPKDDRPLVAQHLTPTAPPIRAGCAKDWPDDFRRRVACEQQQTNAVAALAARLMETGDRRTIRTKCATDWPDDFHMRDFCEREQLQALDHLK